MIAQRNIKDGLLYHYSEDRAYQVRFRPDDVGRFPIPMGLVYGSVDGGLSWCVLGYLPQDRSLRFQGIHTWWEFSEREQQQLRKLIERDCAIPTKPPAELM